MMLKKKNEVNLSKIGSQICFLFGLSLGLVLVDALPQYQQGKLTITNQVWAQSTSNIDSNKLKRYGQAAMQIEKLRKTTYRNIRQIVGNSQSPPLACNQRENFDKLPIEARNMANYYCQQSEKIVKDEGLTNGEFNNITRELKKNSQLRQQLQEVMK